MSAIADLLAEYPPLSRLSGAALERLAHHAQLRQFDAGERILQAGDPANTLYVLRHGRVAIEVALPSRSHIIETLDVGDVVGVSWMLPPFRCSFDARCVEQTGAVVIDAAALRAECDADPELGYMLYKHLAGVVRHRLQETRLRLVDLYNQNQQPRMQPKPEEPKPQEPEPQDPKPEGQGQPS